MRLRAASIGDGRHKRDMTELREIASGLRFPEGPVALPDGDVLVCEIAAGRITRIAPDGARTVAAETGGGPNGAALGPDGRLWVCNNGGMEWYDRDGRLFPTGCARDYEGGSIQRIDLETGAVETVWRDCEGEPLKGPNDLVFDRTGGLWFTDNGKERGRSRDVTGLFYAPADGGPIREAVWPLHAPNGVGLSPEEDRVYVAETETARLIAFDLEAPGVIAGSDGKRVRGHRGHCLHGAPGLQFFDSLAVDADGRICVATIHNGGITVIPPDGGAAAHVPMPDPVTTNIAFGGKGLRTAYITLSMSGRLVSTEWDRPGLPLNFLNR